MEHQPESLLPLPVFHHSIMHLISPLQKSPKGRMRAKIAFARLADWLAGWLSPHFSFCVHFLCRRSTVKPTAWMKGCLQPSQPQQIGRGSVQISTRSTKTAHEKNLRRKTQGGGKNSFLPPFRNAFHPFKNSSTYPEHIVSSCRHQHRDNSHFMCFFAPFYGW